MTKTFKPLPAHIKQYAFDFRWDNQLLWKLDVKTETIHIDDLVWHFDIPWLHTEGGRFDLMPKNIMLHPDIYKTQNARTMQSDVSYPIDVMENKGRWLILDGLHRLMKLVDSGSTVVTDRKIPRALVSEIEIK